MRLVFDRYASWESFRRPARSTISVAPDRAAEQNQNPRWRAFAKGCFNQLVVALSVTA
jgi:hypothetical protein